MADSAIARKLQLKPGHSVLLVNAPDGFRAALDPLPDGVEVTDEPVGGRAGTDLNRDSIWSLVEQHGWAGVRPPTRSAPRPGRRPGCRPR